MPSERPVVLAAADVMAPPAKATRARTAAGTTVWKAIVERVDSVGPRYGISNAPSIQIEAKPRELPDCGVRRFRRWAAIMNCDEPSRAALPDVRGGPDGQPPQRANA